MSGIDNSTHVSATKTYTYGDKTVTGKELEDLRKQAAGIKSEAKCDEIAPIEQPVNRAIASDTPVVQSPDAFTSGTSVDLDTLRFYWAQDDGNNASSIRAPTYDTWNESRAKAIAALEGS